MPNYNPVGVTNSGPGQDFAGRAAAVFSKRSGETDSSGVEDNYPILDEEDDLVVAPDASKHDSSEFDRDDLGGWWGQKPEPGREERSIEREVSEKPQPKKVTVHLICRPLSLIYTPFSPLPRL